MFGISRNKKKEKDPNTIDATKVLQSDADGETDEEIETTLSIPEDWKVSSEERYVFAYHNSESPKLKVNQISIYGMEVSKILDNRLLVTGLIRSTVQKPVQFEKTTILLLGPEKELIARKEFDLSLLGALPPNGARPWKFIFDNVNDVEFPLSEWSLAFELKKKHKLDLEESWEKSIADEHRANLQAIIDNAEPLKPGEVNLMGIQAHQNENKDLAVTILIRNGSDKHIDLKQIPLAVNDASGEEVVRGSFQLDYFTVKANTSKPWTFIFPAEMLTKEELDLSKWRAFLIQN